MVSSIAAGAVIGLFVASLEQTSSYQPCRQSPILQRTRLALSTLTSTVDNLASSVLESGKDVKKLKFEPVFKSFADNKYFVSACRT